MKKIKFILIVLFTSTLFAQTTTIDYSGLTSTDCNVFAFDTTINGVIHHATKGSPTLPNGAVIMDYNYGTGNQKGTGYQINYNFESGYKYIITITAKNGNSSASGATLQARFGSDGSNSDCLGSVTVSNNGGQFFNPITGTTYNSYTIDTGFLSSSQSIMSFLTMSLGGVPNPATQTLYIQKITIEKIAPPMSFSLTPTSTNIACGDTSARTFTVLRNGVPSGSTVNYVWNAGNGSWKNGTTVVTAPITTTTTSLTLTPTSATVLSNVSVTPYLNGVIQPTITCTVNRPAFSNSATLSGNSIICTGNNSIYTISGLGAGNTVTWSTSKTSIATVSGGTQSQVTVNGLSNGTVDLIATITNACGQTAPPIVKTITIGAPVMSNGIIYGELWVRKSFFPLTLTFPAVLGATSYTWTITPNLDFPPNCPATGSVPAKFNNNLQTITTTTPSATASFGNCLGDYDVTCTISNACGSTVAYIRYVTVGNSGTSPCFIDYSISKVFTITQNPIKNGDIKIRKNSTIQIEEAELGDDIPTSNIVDGDQPCFIEWPKPYISLKMNNNQPKNSNSQVEVNIFDFFGKQVYTKTIDASKEEISIKDSNLTSGKYILHINDGSNTQKEIIIIE